MPVDLCYVISHGFAARMLWQSGMLDYLREADCSVAVVTPNADESAMQHLADEKGVQLVASPPIRRWHRGEYQRLRRYLFEEVRDNPALWARHLNALHARTSSPRAWLRPRLYRTINRISNTIPLFRQSLEWLERHTLANPAATHLLHTLQPRLLIATYPVDPLDACLLHAARTAGIRTVGHLLSWDNITTKGRFPVVPEAYIAWGSVMAEEITAYYGIDMANIMVCGVPHFDAHITGVDREQQEALLRALGLDPARPYLFFGMSAPLFCPYEIEVVEWLAAAVEEGRLGETMQLVVRPHPQNVQGHLADIRWLPRLDALASNRVAIDYPVLADSRLQWHMKEEDLHHLINLIGGAAVTLNSGSTLTIDAIVQDKPVVWPLFDATHTLPWQESVRRIKDYPHLAKLLPLGGVAVATDYDTLLCHIRQYLDDPGRDADGRAQVRDAECGPCDGQASRRVAAALVQMVAAA